MMKPISPIIAEWREYLLAQPARYSTMPKKRLRYFIRRRDYRAILFLRLPCHYYAPSYAECRFQTSREVRCFILITDGDEDILSAYLKRKL